jgi:hypothetical protein
MVLVDGSRLVSLMMDHEVGVTSRLLKLPKLDSDYFDDGGMNRGNKFLSSTWSWSQPFTAEEYRPHH